MPTPPACQSLGAHCRELKVTVRISDIEDDSNTLQDAAATWLTGHTKRITFGEMYVEGEMLQVDATVHVPCKYLIRNGSTVHCAVHGFQGPPPNTVQPANPEPRQIGGDRFSVVHRRKRTMLSLPFEKKHPRSLPVLQSKNPCAGAPCRTGDNTRGAACCRDLTLELHLPKSQKRKETLLRARRSPYLCKIDREDEDTVECEVISACGYLEEGTMGCTLHGRVRPNGKPAKPSICTDWPDLEEDEAGHPGCVLIEE